MHFISSQSILAFFKWADGKLQMLFCISCRYFLYETFLKKNNNKKTALLTLTIHSYIIALGFLFFIPRGCSVVVGFFFCFLVPSTLALKKQQHKHFKGTSWQIKRIRAAFICSVEHSLPWAGVVGVQGFPTKSWKSVPKRQRGIPRKFSKQPLDSHTLL